MSEVIYELTPEYLTRLAEVIRGDENLCDRIEFYVILSAYQRPVSVYMALLYVGDAPNPSTRWDEKDLQETLFQQAAKAFAVEVSPKVNATIGVAVEFNLNTHERKLTFSHVVGKQ